MFTKFNRKTREEKKEVVKTAGKVTLGLAGVGALGWFLGAIWGQKNFLDQLVKYANEINKKEETGEIENDGEGKA